MNKKKVIDWVEDAVQRSMQDGFVSIGVDELDTDCVLTARGIELARGSITVLRAAVDAIASFPSKSSIRHVVMFLPIGFSESLRFWDTKLWHLVNADDQMPTLYLMENEQIFPDLEEEYRCPVDIPSELGAGLIGVYRSFRSELGMNNRWEFLSGLYLIKSSPAR